MSIKSIFTLFLVFWFLSNPVRSVSHDFFFPSLSLFLPCPPTRPCPPRRHHNLVSFFPQECNVCAAHNQYLFSDVLQDELPFLIRPSRPWLSLWNLSSLVVVVCHQLGICYFHIICSISPVSSHCLYICLLNILCLKLNLSAPFLFFSFLPFFLPSFLSPVSLQCEDTMRRRALVSLTQCMF